MSEIIEKLSALFARFPGIGPRQAGRFVHFLLHTSPAFRRELSLAIANLAKNVRQCGSCQRFHDDETPLCRQCRDTQREPATLMIVASDTDIAAVEHAGAYRGYYFVLGGTIPLSSERDVHVREAQMKRTVLERLKNGLAEVVLALPANPEGDATAAFVHEVLEPIAKDHKLTISMLGRGLSTGSELEYADPDTIKNALKNRS